MKYDKMVSLRKQKSEQKVYIAKLAIERMIERREKVTVRALVKQTGFSEGFFYRNPEVRSMVEDAIRQQGACYNPKQVIIDKAMDEQLVLLKTANIKLKVKVSKLEEENEKLKEQNRLLKQELEKFC